jgi:hypothetical protein
VCKRIETHHQQRQFGLSPQRKNQKVKSKKIGKTTQKKNRKRTRQGVEAAVDRVASEQFARAPRRIGAPRYAKHALLFDNGLVWLSGRLVVWSVGSVLVCYGSSIVTSNKTQRTSR